MKKEVKTHAHCWTKGYI